MPSDSLNSETVLAMVVDALRDYLTGNPRPGQTGLPDLVESTSLWGPGAIVDSAGFVSVVLEVETRVCETFGVEAALADERAFSQSRSPFGTIGALAQYALKRAQEAKEPARAGQ